MPNRLCFVLMPFGEKEDKKGRMVNFDDVYEHLIKPAIKAADLIPIRADEEQFGGVIHIPMYERLILCDYAIADLTSLNPNVFYELGIRHAVKPHSTIPISSFDASLPFDVNFVRTLPYQLNDKGELENKLDTALALADKLNAAKLKVDDSPVFQLVDGWKVEHRLAHSKTDIFRKEALYEERIKDKLEAARDNDNIELGKEQLRSIEKELLERKQGGAGVIVDLLLSYRSLSMWQDIVDLYSKIDVTLQGVTMVREQYGMALNRAGDYKKAESVLTKLLNDQGGNNPETNGILGRIFKDRYKEFEKSGKTSMAKSYLDKAKSTYLAGFDSDIRDAYPGVNAVTLMVVSKDESWKGLLPVVRYSTKIKMKEHGADYWDYATLLELAIIEGNQEEAQDNLIKCLPEAKESWMPETTINNLKNVLLPNLQVDEEDKGWIQDIIVELQNSCDFLSGDNNEKIN